MDGEHAFQKLFILPTDIQCILCTRSYINRSTCKSTACVIHHGHWTRSIRVCSFVINTPHMIFDGRSTQDRLRHPKVLDVAFAEAKILSLELDPSTATHIIKADNAEDTQQKQGFF
ncbi:uncharacterized protein LACBIDRAFT_314195 [Laccaria bicolor S238N-H82]|uniref:Predicted protein n=1 Tax=Laccaria bicolor (strain S238N-H82 / ATCC MYA-4686) TaxID=486041 RepID=B0D1S9_LACBS|nr:uncharacterized protein LACBIDRAFT_314195 [Laccaria bicolor S238N-H82]EDR11695.1 predicted protein [Laccaria bicolor S238N-H82]|eukprot:XP_001877592.1 predicted protein [Laccaria bicolor S238N-H82]